MDFDLDKMIYLIKKINPIQVNIGADSGRNNLVEPEKELLIEFIDKISTFVKVKKKSNLKRILDNE